MAACPWCDRVLIDPGIQLSLLKRHEPLPPPSPVRFLAIRGFPIGDG